MYCSCVLIAIGPLCCASALTLHATCPFARACVYSPAQSLQERVREYFDFVWKTNTVFDESQILEDLPPFLRDDVIQEAYGELVREVPMLTLLAPSELTALVVRLKPLRVLPSQVIVRAGECGVEMYIVSGGLLRCYPHGYPFQSFMMSLRDLQRGRQSETLPGEVAPREERPPYADERADLLARGDYFGEYCIIEAKQGTAAESIDQESEVEVEPFGETDWSTHARHQQTVVAIETSLLLYITRMQFEECNMLFPHISTSVRHVITVLYGRRTSYPNTTRKYCTCTHTYYTHHAVSSNLHVPSFPRHRRLPRTCSATQLAEGQQRAQEAKAEKRLSFVHDGESAVPRPDVPVQSEGDARIDASESDSDETKAPPPQPARDATRGAVEHAARAPDELGGELRGDDGNGSGAVTLEAEEAARIAAMCDLLTKQELAQRLVTLSAVLRSVTATPETRTETRSSLQDSY